MWNRKATEDVCDNYALRLENALEVAEGGKTASLDPDVRAHLVHCERCRSAFEDAGLSRTLLRWGIEPAEPRFGFSTRVLAAIRAEQETRASAASIFWRPVENLAARVSIAAATAVLLLSFYVYAFVAPLNHSAESAQDIPAALVPQPEIRPAPQTKDDVLMYLAERDNGR
jgi:hypothetical protein